MIVLWTDGLLFLLVLMIVSLGFYLRGKEHLQRPLAKIKSSRAGMVALVVLFFFVIIGLMDSIHFKQANDKTNEVISLLDYWATPIREQQEKSYSAPFSAYLYSKELIRSEDGVQRWTY